jgi:manganese/zinc/iron transport system permease protein
MLAIHLLNHEASPEAAEECREAHLHEHLRWENDFAHQVVRGAERTGLLTRAGDDRLALTERGRMAAREAVGIGA